MKAASKQEFPAREGPEGNEAGRDNPGEHRHPAGNPIEARYFLLRVPARGFRFVLWFTLVSCLLNVAGHFASSVSVIATWVTMMNAISWLWVVSVTVMDIEPEGECQTDEEDDV